MECGFVCDVTVLSERIIQSSAVRSVRDFIGIKTIVAGEYRPGRHDARCRVDERPEGGPVRIANRQSASRMQRLWAELTRPCRRAPVQRHGYGVSGPKHERRV